MLAIPGWKHKHSTEWKGFNTRIGRSVPHETPLALWRGVSGKVLRTMAYTFTIDFLHIFCGAGWSFLQNAVGSTCKNLWLEDTCPWNSPSTILNPIQHAPSSKLPPGMDGRKPAWKAHRFNSILYRHPQLSPISCARNPVHGQFGTVQEHWWHEHNWLQPNILW